MFIGFSDHYHVKGLCLKIHILFVNWLFEKEIRPIPRRGSISKGFDDHYHVEGPDPKNHFVLLFSFLNFWKNRLDQSREESLYQKEINQWPLLCRGLNVTKKSITIVVQRALMERNQWPVPHRGSLCKEIDDQCLIEGLDVTKKSMTIGVEGLMSRNQWPVPRK